VTFCSCSKKSYLDKDSSVNTTSDDKSVSNNKDKSTNSTKDKSSNSSGKCFVQVVGAVNKPGVYELESDSRIFQAILMAGGLREDADESSLNQAQKISDGMKLEIKTKDEVQSSAQNSPNDGKVDINTADASTLMTLPGIGESKANSIIKYRESKGRFNSCEDLKNITGIKDGVYNKIADSIKV
ncbi:MAG TPA: hypothetical protein DCR12_02685, partial [Lachnospiraceae bacterium]|nr:hypothetical protein [Lachnospiraceae bacterium]